MASYEPEIIDADVMFGVLMTRKSWEIKINEEFHEISLTASVRNLATVKHGGQLICKKKMPPAQGEDKPLIKWTTGDASFVINSKQKKGVNRTFSIAVNGKTLVEKKKTASRVATGAAHNKSGSPTRDYGKGGGGGGWRDGGGGCCGGWGVSGGVIIGDAGGCGGCDGGGD